MNIGVCSITMAELWGLCQGLVLPWNKGIRGLQVEVDSICVVKLLQPTNGRYNAASPLVYGILELLSRSWNVSVCHVFREANSVGFIIQRWAYM